MSVEFTILPDHGVVYVRYAGVARASDTMAAFESYMQDPLFTPDLKQFVDLSGLSGMDPDYLTLMKVQAMKADAFMKGKAETLLVYFAPTELALEVARLAAGSWDGVERVVAIVQQDEAEAMAFLGLPGLTMAALVPSLPNPSSSDL